MILYFMVSMIEKYLTEETEVHCERINLELSGRRYRPNVTFRN